MFLQNAVAGGIIVAFGVYLWEYREKLLLTLDASIFHVAGLVLLITLSWLIAGAQVYLVYSAANVPLSRKEAVILNVAGTFAGYLPMRLGTVIRAMYLKQVHGLRFARFGGISGLRLLFILTTTGLMGLFGLALVWFQDSAAPTVQIFTLFSVLFIFPLLVSKIPLPRLAWLPLRIKTIVADLTDSFDELRRHPNLAAKVILLLVAQFLVLGLRFVVSADAMGMRMPVGMLLLLAPLAALISFTAITPGGLGLREGVMGFMTLNLGLSFSDGLFVGTVDRAVLLVMSAVFGGLAFLRIWRRTFQHDSRARHERE